MRSLSHSARFLILCVMLLVCVSCSTSSQNTSVPTQSPALDKSTSKQNGSQSGPTIPTATAPTNDGVQAVSVQDLVITVDKASQQQDNDQTTRSINVTLTIKNTSKKSFTHQAAFYQLITPKGDTFGIQSKVSADFYQPIPAGEKRTGTITFSVPLAAPNSLSLFYRSTIPNQTAMIPLPLK